MGISHRTHAGLQEIRSRDEYLDSLDLGMRVGASRI